MLSRSLLYLLLFFVSHQTFAQCPAGSPGQDRICVTITSMQTSGEKVDLYGYGEGMTEYGPIEFSEQLSWYSDLDGDLGIGAHVYAILSPGIHTITATYGYPGAYYSDTKTLRVRKKFCSGETASSAYTTSVWYTSSFVNRSDEIVKVFWLDYTTKARIQYGTINPSKKFSVNGYPGNRWVVTDVSDNCLGVYETQYKNRVETIYTDD